MAEVSATSLADFLLERIAEDEDAARAVPPLGHNYDMGGNRQDERFTFGRTLPSSADGMGNWSPHRSNPTTAAHFSRHEPARVLAECAAKRWQVRFLSDLERGEMGDAMTSSVAYSGLCRMASIYADHEDFDEAWRA